MKAPSAQKTEPEVNEPLRSKSIFIFSSFLSLREICAEIRCELSAFVTVAATTIRSECAVGAARSLYRLAVDNRAVCISLCT